ncbi:MAG: bifunctional phosphopantothenoylcysteine decarboxylase/phosphopantothenate--cysteine ligase CoaBC [Alphaproteobacteria bacterium]
MLNDKRILLIISGGISAYKSLELIRLIKKDQGRVRCILTKGGEQFVTPLSVASLSEEKVYTDLWSLTDETEMGHIRLSRECDLIIVAPASADLIAKMAHGLANDLASTTLLASNKPIMICPAMNPEMWHNAATQDNIALLKSRDIHVIEPDKGEMACGETGTGRLPEATDLLNSIADFFFERPLKGKKALVTSGPTYEPLDPVRFLGNRSSGKQGNAIAEALRDAGADVTLISGPTNLSPPSGIETIHVETGKEMLQACQEALPADIAVCAAAVSDWTPKHVQGHKIKKRDNATTPDLALEQNPDILKTLSNHPKYRPSLIIGFAAETNNLIENAQEKLTKKGCDWIIANEVGQDKKGQEKTFGSEENQIYLITPQETKKWARCSKKDVALRLIEKIIKENKKL